MRRRCRRLDLDKVSGPSKSCIYDITGPIFTDLADDLI